MFFLRLDKTIYLINISVLRCWNYFYVHLYNGDDFHRRLFAHS